MLSESVSRVERVVESNVVVSIISVKKYQDSKGLANSIYVQIQNFSKSYFCIANLYKGFFFSSLPAGQA